MPDPRLRAPTPTAPTPRPASPAGPRTPHPQAPAAHGPSGPSPAAPPAGHPAGAPPAQRGAAAFAWLDVGAASALVLVAAFAATSLPAGPLRLLLTLPVLLFAPGYLLLQAFVVPPAVGRVRAWQALASLGISPALVGMLALATAIVQGGFRPGAILVLVTLGSLGFAAAAVVRRRALVRTASRAGTAPKTLAKPAAATAAPLPSEAARAKTGPARP